MYGWNGKLLDIDLSSRKIVNKDISDDMLRMLLGGASLGAQLLLEARVFSIDPLEPENVLLFLTGPLTGTNFPGAGRTHIMARSPLTGLIGESSLGGFFATHLKHSGYDLLRITGRSREPVFLEINGLDGNFMLHPAQELWGLDTYQTDRALRSMYPDKKIHTACIGPAGENLVPLASIVHNRHYVAARTGMGAVMGSKNLKAIVAHARGQVSIADEQRYKALRRECVSTLQEDYWAQRRKEFGTVGNIKWAVETGRAPTKNWQNVEWEASAGKISGELLSDTYLTGTSTCHACPITCKRVVEVPEGQFTLKEGPGPEYESGVALGAMLLNEDMAGVLKANDLCNRLGMDTISVGGTLAWAMEAQERGILQDPVLDGISLRWGDSQAVVNLIQSMAMRSGTLGKLLSQGSAAASRATQNGSEEFAIHVKNLEVPYHHPHQARGMEFAYATNPRGASHTDSPNTVGMEDESYERWVEQIAMTIDQSSLSNAYVLCMFNVIPMGIPFMGKVVSAVTGQPWDEHALTIAAERGWYLKRIFNYLCGAGLDSDTLPKRILNQMQEANVDHPDFDHAIGLYWKYRQLDSEGFPSAAKITALGIEEWVTGLERG